MTSVEWLGGPHDGASVEVQESVVAQGFLLMYVMPLRSPFRPLRRGEGPRPAVWEEVEVPLQRTSEGRLVAVWAERRPA